MSKAQEIFKSKIVPELAQKLELKNKMAVPDLEKIVINVGIGKTRENPKFKEIVTESLKSITGQKPKVTKAKKAISGFKIRQNDEIGLVVTLRKDRMYDFSYKLANIVLPRMRDFRGLDEKDFDRAGNFTLALREQVIFPEISHEKAETIFGMSITFVTTAKDIKEGRILLEALGFPFKKD
ncbi:MAG: 50S ribosomal protein L5 [Berkelbacteria bacterium GW2011_GWA1_36_9]|uniref:Large ribosomal subunit protein uL5 n=1 Tax=Berkelbacteria bacterium GW2011_GWA1_36_9 TaxID=1618331 RepID=A0A0G0IQD0_9BACT|nr:MAG: 50S ribosomal protein L5 [Berkelbacteria bacterium GW2011_GWA1_36_9]